ncbi:MAG: TusE/DsrC/DsvC family sulfur relay protein [Thermoleophilia bacterium]
MNQIECLGRKINVDDNSYLLDADDWKDDVARALAAQEGIELNAADIDIIRFMRDYYYKYGSFPMLSVVCRNVNKPGDCVNEEFVDPLKAWKIAGLPEPAGEAVSYLQRPV